MLTRIGPLARRLASEAPATRARAADALRAAIAPHVRDGWLRMPGVVRIIRARN